MSLIILNYIFASGNTIIASQHNVNNSTIYNMFNGGIDYTNISPTANILGSQLSSSAGIVGTQLSASANIAGTQIFSLPATKLTGNVPVSILATGTSTSGFVVVSNGTSSYPQWGMASGKQLILVSGTWTAPSGITTVYITMVGGGGGVAGGTSAGASGAGYVMKYPYAVTPNTGYSVTVGAAGTAISTTGGTTSFGTISAVGGAPGANGSTTACPIPSMNGTTSNGAGGSYQLAGGSGATQGTGTGGGGGTPFGTGASHSGVGIGYGFGGNGDNPNGGPGFVLIEW